MARTVAIVEDDAAIRANYADMLKKHGYQVSAYGDRKSATAGFRTRLPDLALLDIGLGEEPARGGGSARARRIAPRHEALPCELARGASGSHAHRVLAGALARALSRARQ